MSDFWEQYALSKLAGGKGKPSEVYSETEQAVGTWIDGSVIYKRTFHSGAVNINGTFTIPKESGWHIGMYVRSEIIMRYTDSTYDYIWAGNYGNDNKLVETDYNVKTGTVTFNFHNPNPYMDSFVTIYYTKEADT